ncbi:MAG TPA: phytanoyl-CoA dioxygenase family protein, partial [Caulobacteraceae bacterium]|nr:phytanoyl-CoA dioxygenase family protein [Caulobacteraceae bacterium]
EVQLKALALCFARDGFLHVPGVLEPGEVESLGRCVDAAVTARKRHDHRSLDEKSPYEQSFIQCQYLWEDFPDVGGLTFHPAIGRIAGALLGAETVRLWHDQALYKEAGGRDTEAHQDFPYWPISEPHTLTAWIPLCDVDAETGCMGYVPGSHLGEVKFVNIFQPDGDGEALLARQTAQPVFVPCKAGDVIFHDGRTVHLAHPNRSTGTRRVYTAIYFKDGCTRSTKRPHPSVDRDRIAVGAKIDGLATPITWPLKDNVRPKPGPWPDGDNERAVLARRLGVIPG